jgi:hypothetical protein
MTPYAGPERRTIDRVPLSVSYQAAFAFQSTEFSCVMLDLSHRGARFRLDECTRKCALESGLEMTIEIITPYGKSMCTGRIAWTKHIDEFFEWGFEFSRLSSDEKDPLRSLMESEF